MDTGTLNLLQSAIFEDISGDVVESLCSHGKVMTFGPHQTVFRRGEDAQELMILLDGFVELFFPLHIVGVTRDVTMETKQAGEVVAWSALVKPYRFTLSGRCPCQCSLISLSRFTLEQFFETDPATGHLFMRNLAGVIGRRLQAMQTLWMHDVQTSVAKRHE